MFYFLRKRTYFKASRLWPKSREKLPKQLLKLTNNYTMLQNTILRIIEIENIKIQIICNIKHYFIIEQQINDLNIANPVITEPLGNINILP